MNLIISGKFINYYLDDFDNISTLQVNANVDVGNMRRNSNEITQNCTYND